MKDCEYVNIVYLNRELINEEEKSRKWIEKYSFYFSYLFHVERNQSEKKEEIVWFWDIFHQIFKTSVTVSN